MKYYRRFDLDQITRLQIAAQAIFALGVYGEMTRLARQYGISRTFAYQLMWQALAAFEPGLGRANGVDFSQAWLDQCLLLLRLEGKCSLSQISYILTEMGAPHTSIGYLSERLAAFGRRVPPLVAEGVFVTLILCDEIFAGGDPVLVTVEPRSLAILRIELATDCTAATWTKHWDEIRKAGVISCPRVVSDQGPGLVKGCEDAGFPHHPDHFHLLRPLAAFAARYERRAYGAINHEYERGALSAGRSDAVIEQRRDAYEKACEEAEAAMARADNFAWLWNELQTALEVFDATGQMREPAARRATVAAIFALLNEIGDPALTKEVKSLAAGLAGYWDYYERLARLWEEFQGRYPAAALACTGLAWQCARQAINNKDYRSRKSLEEEAALYREEAIRLAGEGGAAMWGEVVTALEAEVRSSSLVENVNSSLRPLLETGRGQVTQELLNLFAHMHNHRRFDRGKRKDQTPMEILTGEKQTKSWIELLLASD